MGSYHPNTQNGQKCPEDIYPAASSKLPNTAIHTESRRSQDYAEKTETIVVHLPTGKKEGHLFSELRLETVAYDGLDSLYRPERTAGMDQAPLIRIPTVLPPRVAFRMPGPVPWFMAETAAESLDAAQAI